MLLRSFGPLAVALALAACSQSQGRQVVTNGAVGAAEAAGYPARMALTGLEQAPEAAPQQPQGGAWLAVPGGLAFGVPGQTPLLSLVCSRDPSGPAVVRLVRVTRAEAGAQALLALIGKGRFARLPLNALIAGEAGTWEGRLLADDPRLDVLKGRSEIEATLPGGGTLMLPASTEPGRMLADCRASDGNAAPA